MLLIIDEGLIGTAQAAKKYHLKKIKIKKSCNNTKTCCNNLSLKETTMWYNLNKILKNKIKKIQYLKKKMFRVFICVHIKY